MCFSHVKTLFFLQTIVTAMNSLVPPVQLACPANQFRIEYILNLTNQKDVEFTPVRIMIIYFRGEGWTERERDRMPWRCCVLHPFLFHPLGCHTSELNKSSNLREQCTVYYWGVMPLQLLALIITSKHFPGNFRVLFNAFLHFAYLCRYSFPEKTEGSDPNLPYWF